MTTKHFSKQELYHLRNDIPVETVIKNALNVPCRNTEGAFRFLCPVCNEFNTAVNPETNLARCFRCKKNFNTIDLVMVITKQGFVKSVRFLKDYQKSIPSQSYPRKANPRKCDNGPVHIGDILKTIIPPKQVVESCGSDEISCKRVLDLERKLESLVQRIEEITKSSE